MPRYTYVCATHGEYDIVAPIGTSDPEHCEKCNRKVKRVYGMPAISSTALPNKGKSVRAVDAREARWAKDMPAYKELRRQGLQPKSIDGSDELSARAGSQLEIETGHLLTREQVKVAQEGIAMARDFQDGVA